jgi:outer membrane protein assembly factor BamB/DNA-directed RNA polymerase subunit RPC12/RpoP
MPKTSPQALNCPTCGAPLEADNREAVIRCKFCRNVILIDALKPGQLPENAPAEARDVPEEILTMLRGNDIVQATRLYRERYDVSQARAVYAIKQIQAGNLHEPEAGFPEPPAQKVWVSPGDTSRTNKAVKKSNLIACSIPVIIILFVGGLIALGLMQPGGPFVPRLLVTGPAILVSPEQDGTADVVTELYNIDDEIRMVGRVSASQGKLLWQSEPMLKDTYVDAIRRDDNLIYVVNEDSLFALYKEVGNQVWKTQMPDKLDYGNNSLVVMNDVVLAITQDRSLQAYDSQTGQLAWSRRLQGYDRELRVMGNRVGIMEFADETSTYSLFLLDPASGSQVLTITPSCQSENSLENYIDPDSGFIYDEGSNSLFLIYGSFDGCIQRFDLDNGQMDWQYTQDDAFAFFMEGFRPLMAGSRFYFNDEHNLYVVDKQTGAVQLLVNDPDYEMLPLMLSGKNLVVRARRTLGSERFELWGLDATDGTRLWQMNLKGSAPLDPPNELGGMIDSTDSGWTWHSTEAGLLLLTFQAEPNQMTLQTINSADGTVQAENTVELKEPSSDFYIVPELIGWRGNWLYFSLETDLYVLDISTRKVSMQYP